MASERWRLFVAVPISDGLRRALVVAVEEWKQRPDLAGLRWTDPASWHVTLAFIGSVEASAVPDLVERLTDAAAVHAPMRVETGGVGAFPSPARARVVWYGSDDAKGGLADLAMDLRRAGGVSGDEPFRGHVTLARARHEPVDVRAWIREVDAPVGELAVVRADLTRTRDVANGRDYEVIASSALTRTLMSE